MKGLFWFRGKFESAEKDYPYIVKRKTTRSIDFDVGSWVDKNPDVDMVILRKEVCSSSVTLSLIVEITYGFKILEDAVAFKLAVGEQ